MIVFLKRRRQDRIAREIAASHNMLADYLAARQEGLSPIEALEEWDLIKPEDYSLFDDKKVKSMPLKAILLSLAALLLLAACSKEKESDLPSGGIERREWGDSIP